MNRGREVPWLNPDRPDDDLAEQSAGEAIIVVESGGRVLGFTSVWEPENFIHHLYVHRDHQGRGVGRMLIDEVARRYPGELALKCGRANDRAMGFYRKTGWVEVSAGVGPDGEYALLKRTGADPGAAEGVRRTSRLG